MYFSLRVQFTAVYVPWVTGVSAPSLAMYSVWPGFPSALTESDTNLTLSLFTDVNTTVELRGARLGSPYLDFARFGFHVPTNGSSGAMKVKCPGSSDGTACPLWQM